MDHNKARQGAEKNVKAAEKNLDKKADATLDKAKNIGADLADKAKDAAEKMLDKASDAKDDLKDLGERIGDSLKKDK